MSGKRKLFFAFLAVIPLLAGGYFLFRERPVEVTVFAVKRGDVEATVTATTTGTVKARAISKVSSQYPGKIERIHKREGARVKKGEVILEVENKDAKAQLSLAEANLRAAEAELSQLLVSKSVVVSQASAMLNQAKAKMDNTVSNHERAVSLFSKGMVPKQDMDNAKAALDVAQADYETAMANELQGKMKDEEIQMARARVEQMKSNLDLAGIQLNRTYISAPFSGIITDLFVEEGELLSIGAPVCQLADESRMEVEAAIDEVDAGKVKLGQDVRLSFDAFKEGRFAGKVIEISPMVTTTKEQNRTVDIKIGFGTGQNGIKVGMSTDVEVVTGKVKDALYIPTNAIIEKADGQSVFVAKSGVAIEKKIKTGLFNWDTTQIIEGLKEGDEVITSLEIKKMKEKTKVTITRRD